MVHEHSLDDVLFLVHFQGGRNVLCLYGYSNQQPDGLSFPDDVIDPDVGRVAAVTLEVMSLRMELEMLIKVWAPHETWPGTDGSRWLLC